MLSLFAIACGSHDGRLGVHLKSVQTPIVTEGERLVVRAEGLVAGARAVAVLKGDIYRAGHSPMPFSARVPAVVVSNDTLEVLGAPGLFDGAHTTFHGDIAVHLTPKEGGEAVVASVGPVEFDAVAAFDDAKELGIRGEKSRAFVQDWGFDVVRDDGEGVRVTRVDGDSKAAHVGLQSGDRVLRVGGVRVLRVEDLAPPPEGGWSAEVLRGDNHVRLAGPSDMPSKLLVIANTLRGGLIYAALIAAVVLLAKRGGRLTARRAGMRVLPIALMGTLMATASAWCDARITWGLLLLSWIAWNVAELARKKGRNVWRLCRPTLAYCGVAVALFGAGGISLSELTRASAFAPGLVSFVGGMLCLLATNAPGRSRPQADLARAWLVVVLLVPWGWGVTLTAAVVSSCLSLMFAFRAKFGRSWFSVHTAPTSSPTHSLP